ncbi:YybH family protein [Flavitalea antarctica]
MRYITILFILSAIMGGCSGRTSAVKPGKQKFIKEIQMAESDFQKMTKENGIAEAFWFYADSNAVIKRENDTLIRGREAIRKYYSKPIFAKASVSWSPDFTDVSAEGDLGYTYGKYTWVSRDSSGTVNTSNGVFHTVWKKQPNGEWKYVWD